MKGMIKWHFGKHMTTDTKWLHNNPSKASSRYDNNENCIINKRDTQKLEAVQMRFLRPLLGVTRLDCQRNHDICNTLKVDNIVEDKKLYQKKWLDHLERMDGSHLQKLAFQYQPQGQTDMERPRSSRRPRTPWALKGQVLRPEPWLCSWWWSILLHHLLTLANMVTMLSKVTIITMTTMVTKVSKVTMVTMWWCHCGGSSSHNAR
jgi:hypothetical protein